MTVEYHWLDGKYDLLPSLMADLVRGSVAVIAAIGDPSTRAAKAATATIPIVFGVSGDPVAHGLVASLARPGGNATGINFLTSEVLAKRLGLLRELVPKAVRVAVLVNPTNAAEHRDQRYETCRKRPAQSGSKSRFSTPAQAARSKRPSQPWHSIAPTPYSSAPTHSSTPDERNLRRSQRTTQIPAAYASARGCRNRRADELRNRSADTYRQVGVYTGRILKGANPADLPVVQSTKFELVINAQEPDCSASKCPTRYSCSPTR